VVREKHQSAATEMMRNPILVFDLGGVLLPFDRQRRVAAMVRAFGVPADDVLQFLASGVADDMDRGECDLAASAAKMAVLAGRPVTVDQAKDLWLSVFEEPNLALWDAVAQIRQSTRTYALSDNPAFVSEVFPRQDAFDRVFWSAELGMTKPARELFARVSSETKTAPAEITFIDDNAVNVEAARGCGWNGILFTSSARLLDDLAARGFRR
jgi:FMN phosphatase YigB (HAD superfamily)